MRRKRNRHLILLPVLVCLGGVFLLWQMSRYSFAKIHTFAGHGENMQEFSERANQYLQEQNITMPLILQKDERWSSAHYGTGEEDETLGTNGCGIASLAMILSSLEGKKAEPSEILAWAGDHYYVPGQGTSWEIFQAFADHYGYSCEGMTDPATIQNRLTAGYPLVLSVGAGEFTATGHILVVTSADAGAHQLRVFDPNDSSQKNHYKKLYDFSEVMGQTNQAWVFF